MRNVFRVSQHPGDEPHAGVGGGRESAPTPLTPRCQFLSGSGQVYAAASRLGYLRRGELRRGRWVFEGRTSIAMGDVMQTATIGGSQTINFTNGTFDDNEYRFAALSRGALEIAARAWPDEGGPDVIHAHDWHAAFAVIYARLVMGERWARKPNAASLMR